MVKFTKKKLMLSKLNKKKALERQRFIREEQIKFEYEGEPCDLTIYLDIDSTLLCMSDNEAFDLDKDLNLLKTKIQPRPYAKLFVEFCNKIAKKVVFITAANPHATVKKLEYCFIPFDPNNIIAGDKLKTYKESKQRIGYCYNNESNPSAAYRITKQIPEFKYNKVLIIDDVPEMYEDQVYDHVLPIRAFEGDKNDKALYEVMCFIREIAKGPKWDIPVGIGYMVNQYRCCMREKPARSAYSYVM